VEARVPCIGKVILLNDFVAAGLGVLVLKPEDIVCLSSASVIDRQPKVCVGAGTGLGEVGIVRMTCESTSKTSSTNDDITFRFT
jgi:glucokinase